MCVRIRKGKVLLFSLFFLFLACVHLLLFVLTTVHVMNELESNTATPQVGFFYMCVCMSWCCLRAVRERGREEGGSREGNRIGCQGERRLCLMRSHPGNLVTPPTQAPPPSLLPSFHLAPFECAHPLNPPPPAFAP